MKPGVNINFNAIFKSELSVRYLFRPNLREDELHFRLDYILAGQTRRFDCLVRISLVWIMSPVVARIIIKVWHLGRKLVFTLMSIRSIFKIK